MKRIRVSNFARIVFALLVCAIVFQSSAPAQSRRSASRYGGKLIKFNVSEITLESIDFRNQTAQCSSEFFRIFGDFRRNCIAGVFRKSSVIGNSGWISRGRIDLEPGVWPNG